MKTLIHILFRRMAAALGDRWYLQLEYLALRHQFEVMKRSAKRPRFDPADRCLWVLVSQWWPEWPQALEIMQADTVRHWRRQGIWHHLKWRRGRKRPGRPPIAAETRKLIREMSRDNRLWGSPRIRGELLKLGISISQTTVAKYMIRRPYPHSPTWRTFIRNQTPECFRAEVYAELSGGFRALSMQCVQVLRRRLRWLLSYVRHPIGRCHERLRTKRSDLVSVPVTWALGSVDPVKVSGRSPPDSQQSSTDHLSAVPADVPTAIAMVDVRPTSSVPVGAAVPLPMSYAARLNNKEQRMKCTQQAAA